MVREKIFVGTKYGKHFCLFEPDREKGGFIVTALDLEGVITWGKNLARAKKMAQEAIELCIECRAGNEILKESIIEKTKELAIL